MQNTPPSTVISYQLKESNFSHSLAEAVEADNSWKEKLQRILKNKFCLPGYL